MLKIKNLSIDYGKTRVVDNVSLDVDAGEIVALIGPNGAGKTSLVRGISGVAKIHSGSVLYGENDLIKLPSPERARILSVVPQVAYLGGAFTVEQVILMGRTPYMTWLGRPSSDDQVHVQMAMEATSILELADRRIAELSGGEQQRVMLARALAQNTPLLVLDEPTNHLDLQHQGTILSLVRDQSRERRLAVLMVLHDLNLVSLYADKAALLVNGRIVKFGHPQEVLTKENLHQAFHTELDVIFHPVSKNPVILHQTDHN